MRCKISALTFHNMNLKTFGTFVACVMINSAFADSGHGWVSYQGKDGPGKGKHVVLLAGDEEYRSEEALPMLAKILSQKHGFNCTVLFSVDEEGFIDPNKGPSIGKPETLDSADVIVMSLRFRKWPDEAMKHFDEAMKRGVPVIGLRTSTHAFQLPGDSTYKDYNAFGKNVLGEQWVSHWGNHNGEATRGVIEPGKESHPLLRGVEDVFGDSDVYEAYPPEDAVILMRGQVLAGMKPTDPPSDRTKTGNGREPQGINDPMMPVTWTRELTTAAGKTPNLLCTTLGAATDLLSEGLRRLVVNGVFWAADLEIPAKADVTPVGEFKATKFSFNGFVKGVKPSDHALK
jgi:type 1 glutamine amidotransferase